MHTGKVVLSIVACMVLAVYAGGCSVSPIDAILPQKNTLITTDEFEGVIFHDRHWVPTVEEVRTLERQLDTYLSEHRYAFGSSEVSIEERLPAYKRQYWGLLENGKKVIFANFFCDALHYDWEHDDVVVVDGGGDCYFQIQYDVETAAFFDLYVNGSS